MDAGGGDGVAGSSGNGGAGGVGGEGAGGVGGVGGTTGAAGATTPTGGVGGAGSGVCPPTPGVFGTWVEVPAPAEAMGFVARDAFAAGADDLYFSGHIIAGSGTTTMQVLHFSHGCFTVDLSTISSVGSEPSVHGLPTGEIWAAGGDQVYRRQGPKNWTPIDASWQTQVPDPSQPHWLTRIRAAASNDLWVTELSNILHYKDGAWTVTNLNDPYYPASGTISFRYYDIWIDSPTSVSIVGGSDEIGNTMDAAMLHHFDGVRWDSMRVGTYDVLAMWRADTAFWLAAPGQNLGQRSLIRYDATGATTTAAVAGASDTPPEFGRLWGRGANDLYAAGTDLAHFDGTTWSLVADQPPSAHGGGYPWTNTFVTGDATAVWIVTPGPRFFRKLDVVTSAP